MPQPTAACPSGGSCCRKRSCCGTAQLPGVTDLDHVWVVQPQAITDLVHNIPHLIVVEVVGVRLDLAPSHINALHMWTQHNAHVGCGRQEGMCSRRCSGSPVLAVQQLYSSSST